MVLQLSTFHWEGGAGVAAARLHQALLNAGIDSQLMVSQISRPGPQTSAWADTPWKSKKAWGNFVLERLHFLPQEKDKSVRFAFSPAAAGADISEHPLVQQASIIHLHWVNFGFLSLRSLEKLFALGKPIVWTLHDMWTFTGGCHYNRGCDHYLSHCRYCPYLKKPGEYDMAFTQFVQKQRLYNHTPLTLISPSRWLDNLVQKAALTTGMPSKAIPNCIDTELFKPGSQPEARNALGLPPDRKLLLFAGANTQDPRKGFTYFREAVRDPRLADVEVLILGKGKPENFADMPVKVHFLGKISETERMVQAYNAADMLIVPSLEDNLPNTIMEAMACGTPVAGFDTGGIPEMIDHLENGFVSVPRSATSLAEGIQWILKHNAGGAVSQNARQKVLLNYSEEVIAAQYSQLYQSLLHG
ncbi:glycosyltransferase family 4 protein [Dyadobacter fermentans]|uniref:Glycosyl transferase group 1 n=1 Tax=Dyadobacter fermentans (strain ATCC 700827 / DSM 18053 / CIP 107007 / KCTC 52180 / NS114) TaxID=471854 RepID=C6W5P8_DYAFD|nr:glycosyltransferase family 4 protein [Dyadobacter fermentans]ACT95987.1 glycosyl transferase group 1 [Dyadobacter fermentans DSM 18053]